MAIELSDDSAITAMIYTNAGESVTYNGTIDGAVSIKVILDRSAEDWPSGFEIQAPDILPSARVQVSDIESPRRGDTILDSDANQYTVDTYRLLNKSEWIMSLNNG